MLNRLVRVAIRLNHCIMTKLAKYIDDAVARIADTSSDVKLSRVLPKPNHSEPNDSPDFWQYQ